MFQLNVGTTPCELTPKEYRELGLMTENYSGSDIAVVVRDALMQPVRKVLSATHFKPVADGKWTPCSPGDPDAVEKAWTEVASDELLEPPLRMADFVRAVHGARPTVTHDDVKRHEAWTNDSGAYCVCVPRSSALTLVLQAMTAHDHVLPYSIFNISPATMKKVADPAFFVLQFRCAHRICMSAHAYTPGCGEKPSGRVA